MTREEKQQPLSVLEVYQRMSAKQRAELERKLELPLRRLLRELRRWQ